MRRYGIHNLGILSVPDQGGGVHGEQYLLDDEFTDTRAAGSVNGTPATPGPGTRTLTDTGNLVSVGAGNSTANGAGTTGDPVFYVLETIARQSGRVILFKMTGQANTYWGVSSNIAALTTSGEPFFRAITTGIHYRLAAVTPLPYLGVLANFSVTALVLRTAGAYLFGYDTQWKMLYSLTTGANTPLAVVNALCSGIVAITFTEDFVRVPITLWLPIPSAYDTFTRANGALGSTEATGPDGQGCTSTAWADSVGTWAIAGNVATCTALAGGIGIATVDTGVISAVMRTTITRAGDEVGIVLRYVDADNYVRGVHDGTNCQLIKRVAGVETTVITAAVAIGAGDIRVISDGTSFSLYLNNAIVGATSVIADAALQTGTRQGLFTTNVGNTMDLFQVFARGTGDEYAALHKWSGASP